MLKKINADLFNNKEKQRDTEMTETIETFSKQFDLKLGNSNFKELKTVRCEFEDPNRVTIPLESQGHYYGKMDDSLIEEGKKYDANAVKVPQNDKLICRSSQNMDFEPNWLCLGKRDNCKCETREGYVNMTNGSLLKKGGNVIFLGDEPCDKGVIGGGYSMHLPVKHHKNAPFRTFNGISHSINHYSTAYESSGSFNYPHQSFSKFKYKHGTTGDLSNFSHKHVFFTSVKKEKRGSQVNFQVVRDEIIPHESSNVNEACLNLTTSLSSIASTTGMQISPKFKESYLDLLITAADELIAKGVTLSEVFNSSQCEKKINQVSPLEDESNSSSHSDFHKKCENKICGAKVNNKSNITQVKIVSMKNRSLWLCPQCYKAWKSGHYCYYCNLIYREFTPGTQASIDIKTWIQCDYCQNWQHMQCEEAKGKYHDIAKLNQDQMFKYMCPVCRKNLIIEDSESENGRTPQKRKSNFKRNISEKTINESPNAPEFLNYKSKCSTNIDLSNMGKPCKKRLIETDGKLTILNYDTRDIYHDIYKISNLINFEEKKSKLEFTP